MASVPILIWLKADSGVSDTGGEVDSWTDVVSGKVFTQTSTQRPTLITEDFNGLAAIDFDSDDRLRVADGLSLSGNPALTISIINKPKQSAASEWYPAVQLGGKTAGAANGTQITIANGDMSWRFGNGMKQHFLGGLTDTDTYHHDIFRRAASSNYGAGQAWRNGNEVAQVAVTNGTNVPNISSPDETFIGAYRNSSGTIASFVTAPIIEMIVFAGELTDDEIEQLTAYGKREWGLGYYFVDDGATTPIYGASIPPPALYFADIDETWAAYEAWNGTNRICRMAAYDHAAATWSGPFDLFTSVMVNDDHGVPSLARTSNGYVHACGGSHTTEFMQIATTDNPNDPSAWTPQTTSITGGYPHPVAVGDALWIFFRSQDRTTLRLVKSTGFIAGVPTLGTPVTIGNLNIAGDGRFYLSNIIKVGTDLHMVFHRSDTADSFREHVYYAIYDTSADSVRNFAGDHTEASGAWPITKATWDANYRLYEHSTTKGGGIPCFCKPSAPHILFKEDDGDTLMHMYWTGSAWSTPAAIADLTGMHQHTSMTIGELSDGTIIAYWSQTPGSLTRGGHDLVRRVWDGVDTWGAPETVFVNQRQLYGLDRATWVLNGKDDFHMMFVEVVASSTDPGALKSRLRSMGYGTEGLVLRTDTVVR